MVIRGYWSPLATRMLQVGRLSTMMLPRWESMIHTVAKKNIMPQSLNECPYKTGALRSTGRVHKPDTSPRGVVSHIRITYGGDSPTHGTFVYYAVIQHERYPNKRTAGTKWKYLEDPVYQHKWYLYKQLKITTRKLTNALFVGK